MNKGFFGLCAAICAATTAHASVLLSDSFSYLNGSLTTNSAFVWATHSGGTGTTGETQVVSGKVQLSSNQGEDVSAFLAGQPYSPAGGTTVFYAAFTVRFTSLPSSSGSYFAHFKETTAIGNFRARVWALTSGASSGKFRLGLSSTGSGAANVIYPDELSLNEDYRVVVRLQITDSVAKLWINPAAESDPSVATSESASTATIATFALRQSGGIGSLLFDDLIVGTNFAEVVSTAPTPPFIISQPTSLTVTQGANATFTVGASGSALSYQWQLDSADIFGATNSSLTLTNVTFSDAGDYSVIVTNALGATNSASATLTVVPPPAPPVPGFSLVTYNTHGNSVADWTTNSPQVRAIGRQMQYLDPDIITFQEIPMTNAGWSHMGEFVAAFRPGFYLATNSATDGFIRSAILSRFPITRSKSYLHSSDLNPFGYTSANFTRDIFEAQIAVPGFVQPLHVFTTHLKSGTSSSDDAARRAAEASAISNFFVMGFLTTNANHPYVLTGDMNEDIAIPATGSQQPIQRLTNGTGLRLTTPVNPYSGASQTFSIRATLNRRYDYIMPNGLLSSNVISSQVFRSDLLPSPAPPLFDSDSETASDHLPVLMVFANPYDKPFGVKISRSNLTVVLTWDSILGQPYRVETSSNLASWSVLASNLLATNSVFTYSTNLPDAQKFFRVYRVP